MTPTLPNGEAPKGPHTPAPAAGAADPPRYLRPRTAQESLGLPAGNGLAWPFVQASAVTAVVLAGLTVGPYLTGRSAAPAATAEPPETTGSKESPPPTAPTPVSPAAAPAPAAATKAPAAGTNPTTATRPPAGGKKDITDVLGESGTKPAAPKVNPLDKKEDDLLKDLK